MLQNVQNQMTEVVQMTPAIEETFYKSEIHTMAYCLAVREVSPKDIPLHNVAPENVQAALEDLVKVGLLIKKKDKYLQKNPQTIFRPSSRFKGSKVHQNILQRSWEVFDRHYQNKAFIKGRISAISKSGPGASEDEEE